MKILKSKSNLLKLAASLAVAFLVVIFVLPLISSDNIYRQIGKYEQIFGLAIKEYFEDVDSGKLTEAAIRGMLQELDPHSTYISPKDMKNVQEQMSGSFEGIGISFVVLNDTVKVESTINDGPSQKVGLMAGDRIVKVDGNSIVGVPQDSIPKLLKGPKGTQVNLGIYRPNTKENLDFVVTRDKIPLYSVDAYFVIEGTDVGYIRLSQYVSTTHREIVEAGRKLKEQGMKKLILDLRGNPGGILDQAYLVVDEFLKGDTVVYTVGRRKEDDQAFVARAGQSMEDIPLIALIDGGSASASEITAGAIQDLDRGLVVGITSFGKGLVQRQFPVIDGSSVRITTARFYTASGRCIQRPFKDKENWKKLTDRLELEEGANLEHTLDKIKKEEAITVAKDKEKNKKEDTTKSINLDSIEVFYTRSGRPVLGGGGITPDYVIKYDNKKLSSLTIAMWNKAIFIEFSDKYVKEIKDKFGDDFNKFNKEFDFNSKMLKDLKKIAESKEIEWKDEEYESDEEYINYRIKSFLARANWNTSASVQSYIPMDRQLKKAIELFPLAEKIQNSKRK